MNAKALSSPANPLVTIFFTLAMLFATGTALAENPGNPGNLAQERINVDQLQAHANPDNRPNVTPTPVDRDVTRTRTHSLDLSGYAYNATTNEQTVVDTTNDVNSDLVSAGTAGVVTVVAGNAPANGRDNLHGAGRAVGAQSVKNRLEISGNGDHNVSQFNLVEAGAGLTIDRTNRTIVETGDGD